MLAKALNTSAYKSSIESFPLYAVSFKNRGERNAFPVGKRNALEVDFSLRNCWEHGHSPF